MLITIWLILFIIYRVCAENWIGECLIFALTIAWIYNYCACADGLYLITEKIRVKQNRSEKEYIKTLKMNYSIIKLIYICI